jgi:hypothetical protein
MLYLGKFKADSKTRIGKRKIKHDWDENEFSPMKM